MAQNLLKFGKVISKDKWTVFEMQCVLGSGFLTLMP